MKNKFTSVLRTAAFLLMAGMLALSVNPVHAETKHMIVDGEKYLPVNEEGMNSIFEIPILAMDEPVEVIADTTAMGTPHEVGYTLLFYADSIGSKGQHCCFMRILLVPKGSFLRRQPKG